jgi:glycosyltransferase involved in cell wall biosynthesis
VGIAVLAGRNIMISVVIPSYNSLSTIVACLNSLLDQSYEGDFEVIVVDSSVDGTDLKIKEGFPRVKMIHIKKRTDPGSARNIGVGQAKGEIVAFIDSDCVASHDWLEEIARAHKSSFNIVGGVVMSGNKASDLVGRAGYISEFREFISGQPKREVMHVPTCNISYKKKILNNFGPFRGEYYPQEDLVYNYNVWKKGERILFNPSVRVYHIHRSQMKGFLYHQHRIGKTSSRVLKVVPLEGAFIVRYPQFAIFFVPFLPFIKFIKTVCVFLRYQPGFIIERPFALVPFAFGLAFWALGFAQGIYEKNN